MVDADGNEVNHWNSERNSEMTISNGMECGDIIVEKYPDIISQMLKDMGNLADLTIEDKSSLVAAINEAAASGGSKDAVTYTPQTLTEEQQKQARANIGAGQPVFVVNVTGTGNDNYTADKTAAEIEAAYQAGCTIVCRVVVPLLFNNIPAELPLKSRMQERVFIFAFDQLVKKEIYTITVQISDSGVEPSFVSADIYEKPASGIPKSDLADDVQTSLDKADTAISYNSQILTEEQKSQARTNIGAYTKPTSGIPKSDLADDVQTRLDNAMQQDGGTYSNYIKSTPTDGVILRQNEMRVGVLSANCVNISKTQINFYKSGRIGLFVDASRIHNLETPSDDTDAANKQYVDAAKTEAQQLGLTAATPGQIIKVKTVQDGKPTEWEATWQKWEKIAAITLTDAAAAITQNFGREYAEIIIVDTVPVVAKGAALGIKVDGEDVFYGANYIASTGAYARQRVYHMYPLDGYLVTDVDPAGATINKKNSSNLQRQNAIYSKDTIGSLYYYTRSTDVLLPSGTKLEIYGVRA